VQEIPAGKRRASSRARLGAGLLSLSLIANAVLAAVVVADTWTKQTETSVATVSQRPTSADARTSSSPPKTQTRSQSDRTSTTLIPRRTTGPRSRVRVHRETKASVERKILALILRSPERLPPALIDRSTGLPENNLQAACRASSDRSFLCVIRPAGHKPDEALRARYRPGRKGRGRFTWYRYQNR
jgi:hypothetical protein